MERPEIAYVTLAAEPSAWAAAGFAVDGDRCRVGRIELRLSGAGAGRRIVALGFHPAPAGGLDGLPAEAAPAAAPAAPAPRHPNAVVGLDHLVAFSPDLDRTVSALRAAGLDFRRLRGEPTPAGSPRQAFFVLGDALLEVGEVPPESPRAQDRDGPARFYGMAFVVDDLDACARRMGDRLGTPRPAVQPGRRIATARREAGLGLPVAFMTPRPEAAAVASG